jgi:hypothetical protein
VASAGANEGAVRLREQILGEPERIVDRARRAKDPGMRRHADEAAQHEVGERERLLAVRNFLKPAPIRSMVGRVRAIGVDEHVSVRKD